jgi:hypothetical protein
MQLQMQLLLQVAEALVVMASALLLLLLLLLLRLEHRLASCEGLCCGACIVCFLHAFIVQQENSSTQSCGNMQV